MRDPAGSVGIRVPRAARLIVGCGAAVVLVVASASAAGSNAAPTRRGTELWTARYNGSASKNDVASGIAVGRGGHRVYVTGSSMNGPVSPEPFNSDYLTRAYRASDGTPLWTRRYNGPAKADDVAVSMAGPANGIVYVTGTTVTGTHLDRDTDSNYLTVAYDARTGDRVWAARYDGPQGLDDEARASAVSADGSTLYVTGTSETVSSADYATVAFDAKTGKRLWASRYAGSGLDPVNAQSLAANPDGTAVYVTGLSTGPSSYDYGTVAYDARTGKRVWTRLYDGPAHASDGATFILASPDGSTVYVTGESAAQNLLFDYATVAYSASSGRRVWVKRYNGPGNRDDIPWHLAASPDGSTVYVTGESVGAAGGFDYATLAYSSRTGGRRWEARFAGPENGDDEARSVAVSADGRTVYVTGSAVFGTRDAPRIDYGTVAYRAATGSSVWVGDYNGPANDHDAPTALAANPAASGVFVTGESEGNTSHLAPLDYATVAYSG
jgi:outer membrane protein assembly factor BamB